jgi:hypothetical protein
MEEKTNKRMQHVSEMDSNDVHENKAGVYGVKETKEGQHLSGWAKYKRIITQCSLFLDSNFLLFHCVINIL